jgi:hypothetical protein
MRDFKAILVFTLACTMLGACTAGITPARLARDYDVIQGDIAVEPLLDDTKKRLFIYLKVTKPESNESYIIEGVAFNPERKELLERVQKKIIASNSPIFLYATKIKGQWQEFIKGADYEIYAIGLYNPNSQRREIILMAYGLSMRDAMNNVKWGDFLKAVGKKGFSILKP